MSEACWLWCGGSLGAGGEFLGSVLFVVCVLLCGFCQAMAWAWQVPVGWVGDLRCMFELDVVGVSILVWLLECL